MMVLEKWNILLFFLKKNPELLIPLQVMKSLRHKYLISFYQAIETTSRHYIIMELAPCGDVLEWIQKSGACSEALAGKWFSQMALGMAYLHGKGIVHR